MKIEQSARVVRERAHTGTVRVTGLMLVLFISGCASTRAPAPVEQRASTQTQASDGYRERVQPPQPEPASGETESAVQVTGLGEDSAPSESLPAWSSSTQSGLGQAPVGATQSAPNPATKRAEQGNITAANPAVVALLNRANRESAAGRQGASAASLERAIKIEPGNAWLWHRLAQTRLKQNKPGEAASIAARSNSLAGNDDALRARNWRLIASVHESRGETVAAQEARSKAERLERGTS